MLNPQIVVLMLGSNDNQPLVAPDGHTYTFATPGWKQEYHRRVGAVMDQLIAKGRWVVYVGVPILSTRNDQQRDRASQNGGAYRAPKARRHA